MNTGKYMNEYDKRYSFFLKINDNYTITINNLTMSIEKNDYYLKKQAENYKI